MKALIAIAIVATSLPALAAAEGETSDRKICTRIERHSGSRIAYSRVCLTEEQWRSRLGLDWRQRLAGRSPEDDLDALEAHSREMQRPPALIEDLRQVDRQTIGARGPH